ncbi:MAG: class I SAM-dependent methyltransferase [Acidobacteriota bacterium]
MQLSANLQDWFGGIDIYLFDQLLKGRLTPQMRIFDAGCGSGRNLVYFLRNGYEVFAVDESNAAIAEMRRLAAQLAPHLPENNFRHEPVERLSFPDSNFEVVISSAVLHFARDEDHWQAMVKEMWRVLKSGGIFFAAHGLDYRDRRRGRVDSGPALSFAGRQRTISSGRADVDRGGGHVRWTAFRAVKDNGGSEPAGYDYLVLEKAMTARPGHGETVLQENKMLDKRKIVTHSLLVSGLLMLATTWCCSIKESSTNNQSNAETPAQSTAQKETATPQIEPGALKPGEASGSYTAKGETVALKYAYAGRGERFGSESIIVLLTDNPIPPEALAEEIKSQTMFYDGKIRGLEYVFMKDSFWVRFHPSQYQESSSPLKDYSVENGIVKASDDDKGSVTDGKYSRSVKFVAVIQ